MSHKSADVVTTVNRACFFVEEHDGFNPEVDETEKMKLWIPTSKIGANGFGSWRFGAISNVSHPQILFVLLGLIVSHRARENHAEFVIASRLEWQRRKIDEFDPIAGVLSHLGNELVPFRFFALFSFDCKITL